MTTTGHRPQWARIAPTFLVVAVMGACFSTGSDGSSDRPERWPPRRTFASNDPVERGCNLDARLLARISRGHHPELSEDVLIVPRAPNFIGTFDFTSHSGPWDYLQNIPLVFYGPHHIRASGEALRSEAQTVDVYPTVGELVGVDLRARAGEVLSDALAKDRPDPPRLIVVVVWDGAGRNTLERWPDRWPNLARLEREGTSYENALVGSSPSVTSAVHSNLGTGAFPRSHQITGNRIRSPSGGLEGVYDGNDAEDLALTTFADEIDLAFGNESAVGLLGWLDWHIGMMGHGAALPGGDHDELALLHYDQGVEVEGNPDSYSTPRFAEDVLDIEDDIAALDRVDGEVDQLWRGHDVSVEEGRQSWDMYSNPAWAALQADLVLSMLRGGDYGRDEVPDFFFTNFKMTDLAGHQWTIDSSETADVLEAQDRALGEIIDFLDRRVGDYVVVVTSDHGHSPSPENTGAWPIDQDELIADIDNRFDVPSGASLVQDSAAWGFYLDSEVMESVDVDEDEIATFINAYTITRNWTEDELPERYAARADEQVFSAAFPSDDLTEIRRCNSSRS